METFARQALCAVRPVSKLRWQQLMLSQSVWVDRIETLIPEKLRNTPDRHASEVLFPIEILARLYRRLFAGDMTCKRVDNE